MSKLSAALLPNLPSRPPKPRRTGLTMMLDPGLPTAAFADVIASHGALIDLVKFGWGTALVTQDFERKVSYLREHTIGFFFGGTLFERLVMEQRFDDYRAFCQRHHCTHVEVSNGTIALSPEVKAGYIKQLADDFTVLSEVGYKDTQRASQFRPEDWSQAVTTDMAAGAAYVVTETRESGRSGLANADGSLRIDVLEAILDSGADPHKLLFEAPTKELQVELIRRLGPNVNLGNIAAADIVAVETLRLGLRSDTMPSA
jgi:phosphosulfolactate synthase